MDESVETLTRAMARSDPEAVARFYDAYFETMYAATGATRRDEAFRLDVVQDAALRIIESARPFEREAAFRAWVRRVVFTCAIDRLRAESRRAAREAQYARSAEGCRVLSDSLDRIEEIGALLASLPREEQALIRLRYFTGLSLGRICRLLGLGPKAVDSRLRRLRTRLAAELGGEDHV